MKNVPKHVAVIPDGNRRWARAKRLPTLLGHKKGFDRGMEVVRESRKMGIHTLTLWAFSTENWTRTRKEIGYLMKLYHDMIDRNLAEAHQYKSKIIHLGRKDRIPKSLAAKIENAEKETENHEKHILNVALDYGGQDEILRSIRRMFSEFQIQSSKFKVQSLSEEIGKHGKYPIFKFAEYLDTGGQPYPYPDLMIRTSGEMRMSGLLLWQAAYAEYYFEEKCFPDFTKARFRKAIMEYSGRNRTFGGNG